MFNNVAKWFESISGKKLAGPKELAAQERHAHELLYPGNSTLPDLQPSRVRMVVFRDDRGVKVPLFDSQVHCDQEGEKEPTTTRSLCDLRSSERLEQSTKSCGCPETCSTGWRPGRKRPPLTRRPSSDTELLGEMMFGSMPIKVAGSSIKVHYIRSTDQLMVTKVFSYQRRFMGSCSLTDFSDSCPLPGEMSSQVLEHASIPRNHSLYNNLGMMRESPETKLRSSSLNVPFPRPGSSLSTASHRSASTSPHTSPHNHSPTSSLGSLNVGPVSSSFTRRIQRSRSTSLENASELYRKVLKPLDQQPPRKGRKFAIGVIVCLSELKEQEIKHFQDFFFSHFTLIDAHLEQLKEGVEDACHNRGSFTATVVKAYQTFLGDFLSLYKAPRIQAPVWLSLVSHADSRRAMCMQFLEELASAIVELDTKETKFFLSSLLTAVLSHHLAWVFTVSRSSGETGRLIKSSSSKSLAVLAESHPYNPLWAQLGDLYGAVTTPLRITRTIVTGQSAPLVCRLLYLLTYFIRCSEVQPGFLQELMAGTDFHQDPDKEHSHDESYDFEKLDRELEGSDHFPMSCASSVTIVSEHDRHTFASPVTSGGESPVIRPHPFGFTHRGNHIEVEGSENHSHRLGSGSEGTNAKSLKKSNSITRSELTSPHASLKSPHALLKSPLASLKSPLSSLKRGSSLVAQAKQPTHTPCNTKRLPFDVPSSILCQSSPTRWCVDCADDSKPLRCDCHYRNTKESCAALATCESMGFCPLYDDGYVRFDTSRKYGSQSRVDWESESDPPRNPSCDSLSECSSTSALPNNLQFSRNASSNSLQYQLMLGLDPYPRTAATCPHQVCGSIDSGYDQSLTASSLTDSSKDSCVTEGFVVVNYPQPEVSVPAKGASQGVQESTLRMGGSVCSLEQDVGKNLPAVETRSRSGSSVSDVTPQTRKRSCAISFPDRQSWKLDDCVTLTRDVCPLPNEEELLDSLTYLSGRTSHESSPFNLESNSDSEAVYNDIITPTTTWPDTAPTTNSSDRGTLLVPDATPTASLNLVTMSHVRGTHCTISEADSRHSHQHVVTNGHHSDCESDTSSQISQSSKTNQETPVIDVEQSLSASLLSSQRIKQQFLEEQSSQPKQRSLLEEQLLAHDERMRCGAPPFAVDQLQDFTEVELPCLDEFHLNTSSDNLTLDPPSHSPSVEDFGHSLLVGHSPCYLPDFVLHGTSEPPETFHEKMSKDLANVVKHSIIDEPIDHGVAIVADTNTWTCRVVVASKTYHNNDVVLGCGGVPHSRYVRQLLSSVKSMWEMKLPPEFCLSHVEDCLLELSERGASLANTLMEYGSDTDLSEVLPRTLEGLSIHNSDVSLLLALAGIHCNNTDLSARLNYTFIQRSIRQTPA